jgi:hypothetical protein
MGMKRPERNEEMVREAGREWAQQMQKWASAGDAFDDVEAAAEDLVKCYRQGISTFNLAKELDDRGWEIDDDVLDELGSFECIVDRIHEEAVEKWITGCDIKPGFELGARVTFEEKKWGAAPRRIEGMVTSIDMKRGTFTVSCPELGHWNELEQGRPPEERMRQGVTMGRVLNWENVAAAAD